jgi:hypothetical protein
MHKTLLVLIAFTLSFCVVGHKAMAQDKCVFPEFTDNWWTEHESGKEKVLEQGNLPVEELLNRKGSVKEMLVLVNRGWRLREQMVQPES